MANKNRDNVNTKGRGQRAGARVPIRGGSPGAKATGIVGRSTMGRQPSNFTAKRSPNKGK